MLSSWEAVINIIIPWGGVVGATEVAISSLCGLLGVIVDLQSGAIGWGWELWDLLLDKLYDAGSDFVREQKEPRHIRLGPVAGVRLEGLLEFILGYGGGNIA